MNRRTQTTERSVLVTIRSPAKTVRFDTWRYWEIVAELQMIHTERAEAVEAANWCLRAKPGDRRELANGIVLEVEQ
jgi:hypothetical protein